jgi:hypothetical protein
MTKKTAIGGSFFPGQGQEDPVGKIVRHILNKALNVGINNGTHWLDRKIKNKLGLNGMSPEEEIELNRSRTSLKKQEVELFKIKALSDRQIRILDIKIAEKEMEMERARASIEAAEIKATQLALPAGTEMIRGALEVAANPEGITGQSEELEGYNAWQEGIGQGGKVVVIVGGRGSGKTCLGAKIVEYSSATYGMPALWLGLPPEAGQWLATWITITDDPSTLPMGCIVLIDESGLDYCSLLFNTARNRFMRALLMITRHRHCTLIFCVQSTADLDLSIIRAADTLIFKKLALNQIETERPSIRKRAAKADLAFDGLSKIEALESAYVFDRNWEGMITFSPPSFWSESLSCAYAYKDLVDLKQKVTTSNELKRIVTDESSQLNKTDLDTQILRLRREGHGFESISKILGCSTYRVRKLLEGTDNSGL